MKTFNFMLENESLISHLDSVSRGHKKLFPTGSAINYVPRSKIFCLFVTGLIYTSSLGLMSVATNVYAQDTVITGSGKAPAWANDFDITWWVNNTWQKPSANFVGASTMSGTIGYSTGLGSATGSGYTATADVPLGGSLTAGQTMTWTVTLSGGQEYKNISWWWTSNKVAIVDTNGNKIGGGTLPNMNANGSVQTSMILSLPDGVASIAVTDFSLYGNQDPGIGTNTLVFGDFSQNPFTGSPVSGIPATFTLDAGNPSITFSAQDYPGLATSADNEIGWSATIDGIDYRGLMPIPEPSTITMLGFGGLSLLAYAKRQRSGKA